jgi:hypothetical protein
MRVDIPPGIVYRNVSGETVLLNLETGVYSGLDAVGSRVWELLVKEGSTEAAIRGLLEEFDVEEERLRADVDGFVRELSRQGLARLDE